MSILLDTVVAVSQLYVCSTMLSTCRGFTPVLSGVITRRSSDGYVIEQKLFCYHMQWPRHNGPKYFDLLFQSVRLYGLGLVLRC